MSPPPGSDSSFLTAPSLFKTDFDCLDNDDQLSIRMPHLFASVMGMRNRVNPHYHAVKVRCDAYIKRTLGLSDKAAQRTSRADFAFLTSSWIPDATEEALYVIQLWQEWVFFFDDQFDEGHLSQDPLRAAEEVVNAMAVLDATYPILKEDASLAFILQKVWLEFRKTASEDHQYRFKFYHKKYMIGLLRQVTANISAVDHVSRSLDKYVEYRRDTIGAEAPYVMMEWAYGLSLPAHVISHPSLIACCVAAIDITWIDNDILSLQKDLDYDVKHNIVNVLCSLPLSRGGVSTIQQAVDKASDMLDERYATWLAAVAALPTSVSSPMEPRGARNEGGAEFGQKEESNVKGYDAHRWTPEIEAQVRTLLELYIRIPIGTLHWSFRSGRYFGDKGQEIRESRVLRLKVKDGRQ